MSREKRTTIEINGRIYDAVTGKLLEQTPNNSAPAKPPAPANSGGQALDGFVNTPGKSPNSDPQPAAATKHRRPPTANHVHHRTKKSQTLNRSVVTPPKQKQVSNQTGENKAPAQPGKHSLAASVAPTRKARAAGIIKSQSISKFGSNQPLSQPQPPAQTEPDQPPAAPPPATPEAPTNLKNELIARQLAQVSTSDEGGKDSRQPAGLTQRVGDWVAKKRLSSLVATSLAAVLLIGYVTYINIPRIALRVAAGRAGFEAQMPSYSPSGFSFSGPVAYSPGQITIQFSSNTDGRAYTITEQETNWDSQTLLANHVLDQTELYSTYQERGLTVYVYEGSNATWVNGGIWYTVEGESELSAEQLLKIAASL